MYKKLRWRIYSIIHDDMSGSRVSGIVTIVIMSLIIINVLLVIIETFKGIPAAIIVCFHYIELVSVIIFTAEYILRLWTAVYIYPEISPFKARIKHALSFMAIIDILAILPFYLPFAFPINAVALRLLRLLRLVRIIKMNRYTVALSKIANVIRRKAPQLISSLVAVSLLMVLASLLVYSVEHDAQPDAFENAFSGLWWAMATLTTVGYGDIAPVTMLGKLFGMIIALMGIGLVAVPTGIISAGFIVGMEDEKKAAVELAEKQEEAISAEDIKHFCPYCGKKIL